MDSPTQSSFIPQDAASLSSTTRMRSQGGLSDLLLLLTIVAFVASVALAGTVFLYNQYLQTKAKSELQQLQRAKDAFEPSLITTLTRLDDRMHVAGDLLTQHIAPTAFFSILQQATLQTVSFRTLEFDAADSQRVTIKMTGVAQSVNSIALQADLFSKNGTITNPIFSDIDRQLDGVHFNLTALVNPQSVNFVRLINGLNNAQAAQTDPSKAGSEQGGTQPQTQTQGQTQTTQGQRPQQADPFGNPDAQKPTQ